MATISDTTFDTAGNTLITVLPVDKGENIRLEMAGTYVMVVDFQREVGALNSGVWEVIERFTAASVTVDNQYVVDKKARYRLFLRTDTSGSISATISDGIKPFPNLTVKDSEGNIVSSVDDDGVKFAKALLTSAGLGTVNAAATGLSVKEYGDGVTHKTVLTLVDVAATSVTVTTGNGVGGILLYTFPEGAIGRLGCTADLAMSIAAGDQADYTDNTPEGDVGIGTVLPANADALGTDATDDDWATSEAFTGIAFTDVTVEANSEASGIHVEAAAPLTLNLNNLIDAADQDDDNTSSVTWNGTITFVWYNLGDMAAL